MKRKDIPQARHNMVKRLALYCDYKKPVIVITDYALYQKETCI